MTGSTAPEIGCCGISIAIQGWSPHLPGWNVRRSFFAAYALTLRGI